MNLETAVRAGDLATATERLRAGADPDHRGPEGLTPLMIACGLGQPQMVELLLTAGADVLAVEPRMGATAIHKAAQSGKAEIIGLLLDRGAFADQQSPVLGNTPLIDAVLYRNRDAVRLLLDRGARTTIRNHWQQTAVELARSEGLDDVVELIEARDEADVARVRATPLIAAVKAGDAVEVERLVAAGASVEARVPMMGSLDDDYTPLGLAVREGHLEIARVLLVAGADPRCVVGLYRGTPVHEAGYFGHVDILELFLEGHTGGGVPTIELDTQGAYNGLTPLHDAIWQGHPGAARALVEAGARLDLRTHAGRTPGDEALAYGHDDLARYLAEAERR